MDTNGTSAHHTVVAMGRMEPQKGFDRLLMAFAKCAERHPEWTLRIVGEGTERPRLHALAVKLGLESRVRLDTVTKEPEQVLRDSDLFVLSSRYEGFPNGAARGDGLRTPGHKFRLSERRQRDDSRWN